MYEVFSSHQHPTKKTVPKVYESFRLNLLHYGKAQQPVVQQEIPASVFKLVSMVYADWRQQLSMRPSGLLMDDEAITLPRAKGTLLHQALSLVQHPDELGLVMDQLEMKGIIQPGLKADMQILLQQVMDNPLFTGWKNGTMQRISERDIVTAGGHLKRPDIILTSSTGTLVIDFKFTEGKDDKLRRQVEEYMHLLQQMHFPNIKGYLLYGLINEAEEIIIS